MRLSKSRRISWQLNGFIMRHKIFGLSTLVCVIFFNIFTAAAQHPELTIVENAPLRIHLGVESEQIGTLEKGTKVKPLAQTGLTYKVETKNGNVGWVAYEYFDEAKELVIKSFKKPVPFFESLNERRWRGSEKIRDFDDGEIVTYLEGLEPKGFVKVRDSSGRVGYTYWQRARPALDDIVPEYEQLDYLVLLQQQVEEEVLNNNIEVLSDLVGPPDARFIDQSGDGFIFYRKLYLVSDGERVGHIRFEIENNIVTSFEYQKGPESFWIESMPLAEWFRTLDFGVEFQKMQGYDLFPPTSAMGFWKKWGWRLLWLITIILFFSIPHFIASLFTTGLGYIKALSNGTVIIIGVLLSYILIYFYFLFMGLHMMHDQHWLFVIGALIVAYYSTKVLFLRIEYHRCPNPACHSFFKSENIGSQVVGKKHVTEHKHRDVYKGTRETSTEIIKEYERQHYTEESTEIDYDDYQECTECGEIWEVHRFKIVRGHI